LPQRTPFDQGRGPGLPRRKALTKHPFAGTGSVDEHCIEETREPVGQARWGLHCDSYICGPPALQISCQLPPALWHHLVGNQQPLPGQARRNLGRFAARRSREIEHDFTWLRIEDLHRHEG